MIQTNKAQIAVFLLLLPSFAFAQFRDMWGTQWNNPVSSFIGSSIYWKTMTHKPKKQASPSAQPDHRTSSTAAAKVSFSPDPHHVMTDRLAASFSDKADERKELAAVFTQFLDLFNGQIASGEDRFNVASAAAFFIVSTYTAACGREVGDQELAALRDALQINLAGHQSFQRQSARQRQELYESLIIFALLARYGYQEGLEKGDKLQMQRFRDFAGESLKAVLGVKPEQMVFTAAGLEYR